MRYHQKAVLVPYLSDPMYDMKFGQLFTAHLTGLGYDNCHTLPYGNAARYKLYC